MNNSKRRRLNKKKKNTVTKDSPNYRGFRSKAGMDAHDKIKEQMRLSGAYNYVRKSLHSG